MNLFLTILLFGIISPPSFTFDPNRSWYTLQTDNFSIHFSAKGILTEEKIAFAQEVAGIAEEVHKTFLDSLGLSPKGKVNLIIADFLDSYNGWAVPLPENTITIIPTPPSGSRTNEENWLRGLILHEYSHILQMDKCAGVNNLFRRVFGRVVLPNALLPTWLLEGYCIYNETRFSNFGRLRSAEWQMMLRAAVKENRLLPIDRCGSYFLQTYPNALAPYLYGSNFFEHLVRKHSGLSWERFNLLNAHQLPFFENRVAKKVFGAHFPFLWQNWQKELIPWVDSIEKELKKIPITNVKPLTYEGYNISSPCWSRNGAEVYYLCLTAREEPAIKALNLGALTTTVLYRGRVTGSLATSFDGRWLAFTQTLLKENGYEENEIFLYEFETKKVRQLTFNERAQDPDFAPDSNLLVYVRNFSGKNELVILDLNNGEQQVICEGEDKTLYHQPKFSPGGRLLAVGVWRPGGYADIELIDLKTGWTIPITQDRANDLYPAWSRTGKFLFFISDRTGIYNLYAYGVESKKLYRCTNVQYGVFEPAVSPDNKKIALVSYSANGYDIGIIDLKFKEWHEAEEFKDPYPEKIQQPVAVKGELYYYHPYPSLLPKFWLPWLSYTNREKELGGLSFGWDVLQFHKYWLIAGYRFNTKTPFCQFGYELHRYRPIIQFDADFVSEAQKDRIGIYLPFYTTRWTQAIGFGVNSENRTDRMNLMFDGFWGFNNDQTFRFCVAPVQGRNLGIFTNMETKPLAGKNNLIRLVGYWAEYIGRPPATWSGRIKLTFGSAFGDSSRLTAFSLSNSSGLFTVRGYPSTDSFPSGSNILAGGIQFRIPLFWAERGIGTTPVFFRNINAALFWDAGMAVSSFHSCIHKPESIPWRSGVGLELRFDFLIFHYLPINFATGGAIGLTPKVSHQFYLRLESEMLNFSPRFTRMARNQLPSSLL